MSDVALLTVDAIKLPNPSGYDPDYKDLDSDNSFTSETGKLNRDMIRGNHRTVHAVWNNINFSSMRKILRAISADDNSKEKLSLTYFDYYSASFKTGEFYAHDRNIKTKRIKFETSSSQPTGRFDLTVDLIEF